MLRIAIVGVSMLGGVHAGRFCSGACRLWHIARLSSEIGLMLVRPVVKVSLELRTALVEGNSMSESSYGRIRRSERKRARNEANRTHSIPNS